MSEGWRDPESSRLDDVVLTGDELLHIAAIWGESRWKRAQLHKDATAMCLNRPWPGCEICVSIMGKVERVTDQAEGRGGERR